MCRYPGGTTGHATGATLIAILIGPWAAIIAVSIALIIQSFMFGDGGITAVGANCFNIAFAEVLVGYGIYRIISSSKFQVPPQAEVAETKFQVQNPGFRCRNSALGTTHSSIDRSRNRRICGNKPGCFSYCI